MTGIFEELLNVNEIFIDVSDFEVQWDRNDD